MRGKKVNISVTVRGPNGKKQNMGSMEFRVKQVPDRTIYHLDKDKVSKEQIMGRPKLSAKLENFEFEGIVFRVVQFDITCVGTVTKHFERKSSIFFVQNWENLKSETKKRRHFQKEKASGTPEPRGEIISD